MSCTVPLFCNGLLFFLFLLNDKKRLKSIKSIFSFYKQKVMSFSRYILYKSTVIYFTNIREAAYLWIPMDSVNLISLYTKYSVPNVQRVRYNYTI